jgi:hypothetical protein
MKKLLLIGVGFVLAVALFGVAGFAFAQVQQSGLMQTQDTPEPLPTVDPEFPDGLSGWSRGFHGGRLGDWMNPVPGGMMDFDLVEGEGGPLHDYLWPALAEAFDLTDEQVEAFEIVRETTQGIREDLTPEEIGDAMQGAMSAAIENALADGAITEEQAESWLERVEQMDHFAPGMPFGGRGRMGNYRQGFPRGVEFGRQMMVNHEYLDAAIAEALDISVEELEEIKTEQGLNLKAYADEQGLSEEDFAAFRLEIFRNAVNMALVDGAITQEQADWVLERLENNEGRGGWLVQP